MIRAAPAVLRAARSEPPRAVEVRRVHALQGKVRGAGRRRAERAHQRKGNDRESPSRHGTCPSLQVPSLPRQGLSRRRCSVPGLRRAGAALPRLSERRQRPDRGTREAGRARMIERGRRERRAERRDRIGQRRLVVERLGSGAARHDARARGWAGAGRGRGEQGAQRRLVVGRWRRRGARRGLGGGAATASAGRLPAGVGTKSTPATATGRLGGSGASATSVSPVGRRGGNGGGGPASAAASFGVGGAAAAAGSGAAAAAGGGAPCRGCAGRNSANRPRTPPSSLLLAAGA